MTESRAVRSEEKTKEDDVSGLKSFLRSVFVCGSLVIFLMSCDTAMQGVAGLGDTGDASMSHSDSMDSDSLSDDEGYHGEDENPQDVVCDPVTIQDTGLYWNVVLNYECGVSRREMGYLYAEEIFQVVPDIQKLVDSYLTEQFYGLGVLHSVMMGRIDEVLPQVDAELRDELEGIVGYVVDVVHGGVAPKNEIADGVLSRREIYFLNLFPDVGRPTACSGVSVFGSRSATGNPILLRLLDWSSGSRNQLNQLQAIITIKNGSKSVTLVGYLGMLSVITAFNEDGVFSSILDSTTGALYPSWKKRDSYVYDLRYAMENFSSLEGVADYMKDKKRVYSYNHNILLADKKSSKVLENNISGLGLSMGRRLRSWDSDLHWGVDWGFKDAIGVVNSFLLNGNHNNHTLDYWNVARFKTMKSVLAGKGDTVDKEELKQISYESEMYDPGWTQHIVVFEPTTLSVEVFFLPRSGEIPKVPTFEPFNVQF